jgi:hypothetical protein
MAMKKLGSTRTGAIINITRLCILLLAVACLALAIVLIARVGFSKETTVNLFRIYTAAGLFVGGIVLVIITAWFKIQSQPFLLSNILYQQMEQNAPIADVESFLKTYKAQIGVAGFFNRLGFSGLSLGTIASAFLVLIIGMLAVQLAVVPKEQFSIFADIAKLLFGAFIGSFATDHWGKAEAERSGT